MTSNQKLKIVFFGTGPISVTTADQLSKYFDIEAIITKTDPTSSSGKATPTLLASWANEHNIPTHKVANKVALDSLLQSTKFEAQVGVVVDFGIIISEQVINSFPKKILNSHFSLLPKYRGADPITAALLSGDETTGVSIMIIEPTLDTGALLAQETFKIRGNMEIEELETALTTLGIKLLIELIPPYLENIIVPTPQKGTVSHTKLLTKEDGRLDPNKTADQLANQVRAFLAWPKSYLEHNGQTFIITKAQPSSHQAPTGKLSTQNKKLYYGCKGDSLEILEIQPAGKTKMNASAFINGYNNLI